MVLRGRARRAVAWLIVSCLSSAPLAAAGVAPVAHPAPPASGGAAKPVRPPFPARPQGDPRGVALPSGHPLPDSVLAVVGDGRTVSTTAFWRGWAQLTPPARPDSLTPQSAREFLDLLVDKELLAARAAEERWEWTSLESAQVANLRDRTVMRVTLDSTLQALARERAARGEPPLGNEALGVAARESTVARLGAGYDEVLLARVAKVWGALPRPTADSSIWSRLRVMGQMPVVDPADSGRVVGWSQVGPVRVADLLDAWKKLNPLFRPRVETVEQARDLVKNALFERVLRRTAEHGHLDRHPAVVDAVRRQEEYLASQYLVARDVYGAMPMDDATLRRVYDRDPGAWAVPARIQVVRLLLPTRSEGARMVVRLRDAAEADSLVARGLRERVDYLAEITAEHDSALFAAATRSGTGTVLGPDSVAGGWQVARVNAMIPARVRSFDEARDLVKRAWTDEEGERRMRELLTTLRRRTRVVVHERALAALVSAGRPAPGRSR